MLVDAWFNALQTVIRWKEDDVERLARKHASRDARGVEFAYRMVF
jgi:hypothetical protein